MTLTTTLRSYQPTADGRVILVLQTVPLEPETLRELAALSHDECVLWTAIGPAGATAHGGGE